MIPSVFNRKSLEADRTLHDRRALHVFITALLMISLLLPASVAAGRQSQPRASIDPAVIQQLDSQTDITFWVVMREKANLAAAYSIGDWEARGLFVYQRLQAVANRSQAQIRGLLMNRRLNHQPYWIANAIRVTADKETLQQLAARPDVERIVADGAYSIPPSEPANSQPGVDAVEWNIDRIRAPEVWSSFGIRGEGIVIANIDTGVQFDHEALVAQYRGNQGGSFDHNYNWFDPSQVCGSPSLVPCDNNGHGTHTMGTMVGDDGSPGVNQIGVAPGARWMAAKGCETNSCSFSALLAAGQWLLAPTDLDGANPRADLRPNVVNNSWGGGPGDPFYQDIVNAWIASGIFPQFSNGNSGPGCGSSGSPGDYTESYSAGAFDINNQIAWFSSRGQSAFGDIKPNISAPGVDVRSSVPGGYAAFSGTSMASPHVAGTVALMWSAAPALLGDVAATRVLLDQTAIDVDDTSCGGSAADNNIWGEGRLDAFVSVEQSPRGPQGSQQGMVTDASTGLPISGALVHAVGPIDRVTYTDEFGNYSFPVLSVGTYEVSASLFAYLTQAATVEITEGSVTVQDFALELAPAHAVSGTVQTQSGVQVQGAVVSILGMPIPAAITDQNGFYNFASVPEGEYDVHTNSSCYDPQTQHLIVNADSTLDFSLAQHADAFGYTCEGTTFNYIEASNDIGLYGDDSSTSVSLPFPFVFYGQIYDTAYVGTNGFLNFQADDGSLGGGPLPDFMPPNAAIYAFWDDLYIDPGNASIRTELLGSAPNRQFVIEWRDAAFCCITAERVRVEIVLFENGRILMQYASIDGDWREQGGNATVGIENESSSIALQYSFHQPVLSESLAVLYTPPPMGFVEGYVTDGAGGAPLEGVQLTALETGDATMTDADGFYRMFLLEGVYTLEASLTGYETEQASVNIVDGQTVVQNFVLRSPRAEVSPAALEFLVPVGQTETQTLTLSNIGQANLNFSIGELPVEAIANAPLAPEGTTSQTAAPEYQPVSVASVNAGGPVLVFMDMYPWGSSAIFQILDANGIGYNIANSSAMGSLDLSPYEAVFISSDQPTDFYNNYNASFSRFEDYVYNGGFLWVGAAAWGWNGGDFTGGLLPGGATVGNFLGESQNEVVDPAHPVMQGVPSPMNGNHASHTFFENLPAGANVIARGQNSGLPTTIEYDFGGGRVLALAQTLEFGFPDIIRILENGVPYAYSFEPFVDLPWLSEDVVSGTLAPGDSQAIRVTVDTTGLTPGIYRARVIIVTNDVRNPRIQIPVTLIVPAYLQGVNAGGTAYTDLAGNVWSADRQYSAGSWGYVNRSTTASTRRAISGTDDDRLYQSQRQNILEYRFDGLAPGVYQVDLLFAELKAAQPNTRRFDIMIEGSMVLIAHDIALEVGSFAADNHTFYVVVTDGTLNIRFISYRSYGQPVINALRVIHRPDR
jgi:subtilisin family serine protease